MYIIYNAEVYSSVVEHLLSMCNLQECKKIHTHAKKKSIVENTKGLEM
jgi:hypothetical protein